MSISEPHIYKDKLDTIVFISILNCVHYKCIMCSFNSRFFDMILPGRYYEYLHCKSWDNVI